MKLKLTKLFMSTPSPISIFIILIAAILLFSGCKAKNSPVYAKTGTRKGLSNGFAALNDNITESFIIGYSVQNRPIEVTRVGNGKERAIILIGGIHGEERNTVDVIKTFREKYIKKHGLIPENTTLFFLPLLNQDGFFLKTRENARNVDLNHNFPAKDWQADAMGIKKVIKGIGGTSPGSEPEVRAIIAFLTTYVKPHYTFAWALSFHSACPPDGYIQPGYVKNGIPDPDSARLAEKAASVAGYKYLKGWTGTYPMTGELIHYCAIHNIRSMDIELPSYDPAGIIPQGKKESSLDSLYRMIEMLLGLKQDY